MKWYISKKKKHRLRVFHARPFFSLCLFEVSQKAKTVKPSARNQLEITHLNGIYLRENTLNVKLLGRGFSCFDTGTMDNLLEAALFVQTIQKNQGLVISSPEEIAYKNGWIDLDKLLECAERYGKSPYGKHLKSVAEGKIMY